ncbi:MFS transporter [Rhodococcus aetherivorans]|uniref:MFS transporter n=1 Tax=Rhodococcus aetherivorans TaxID=191292 RepID=UPI0036607E6C
MHGSTTRAGSWPELLGREYLGTASVLAGGVALYATNVYLTTSLLPTAVEEIGGHAYYAWTATVFLIASVISSTAVARLLAARGPRGAYLVALGTFAAGTLVCALAPSMETLLAGRAVQGLGGGLLAGLGYAVLNSALPERLWSRGAALVSAMWGVGTFAGPAVGGVFAQFHAWRWAFGALVVCTLAVAAAVPFTLPAHARGSRDAGRIPLGSLALLTAAALAVSVAAVVTGSAPTITLIAVASAAVVAFVAVAVDRRSPHGILPAATFTTARLRWVYLTIAVLAVASTAETFVPLFGQRLAGLAPLAAGFLGAALAVGWTLGEIPSASASAPRTVHRIVVSAPVLVGLGLALMATVVRDEAGPAAVAAWVTGLVVAGAGIGIAWPHLAVGAMNAVADPRESGRASAAINTVQLIANAFGAALAGVLVNAGQPSDVRSARLLLFGFAAVAVLGVLVARRAVPARAHRLRSVPADSSAVEPERI